jgi:hypothetical protein
MTNWTYRASGTVARISCALIVTMTGISCGDKCLTCPGDSRQAPQRTIAGLVKDAVFEPIAGAQVAVVGSRLSTLTAADGSFELTGGITTPASVRVTKDGYASETRAAAWYPTRTFMVFTLYSLGPSVDVSGDYAVTLTADSSCSSLPSEARARTFTASFARTVPTGTRYFMTVQSPSLEPGDVYDAGVSGNSFVLRIEEYPGIEVASLVDIIAPDRFILSYGRVTAELTPDASQFSAVLDGAIAYCHLKPGTSDAVTACHPGGSQLADPTPGSPAPYSACRSTNHSMLFTRR